jgi:hypothetical protein
LEAANQRVLVAVAFFALLTIGAIVWAVMRHVQYYNPEDRGPDPGKAAAEKYALEYIDALNANDPELLSKVAGWPADAPDILEGLRLYGGRDLTDVEVAIVHEFRYHYQIWITARAGDGSIVEMYQVAGWTGERWNMSPLYTGPPPPRSL